MIIEPDSEAALIGIFDGHGGQDCSNFCAEHLLEAYNTAEADSEPERLAKAVALLDQEVVRQHIAGGSAALVVTVDNNKVALAHLGDSSAVLVRNGQPLSLVTPHHPDRPDEFRRIDDNGGVLLPRG